MKLYLRSRESSRAMREAKAMKLGSQRAGVELDKGDEGESLKVI